MAKVPVAQIDANGVAVSTYHGAPCVRLRYTFTTPTYGPAGETHMVDLKDVWALIDTGADFNVIDESLVPSGLASLQVITNSGITGTHLGQNYPITLLFPEWDRAVNTGVITMPTAPRPYQLILGRKFMQNVRFEWNGANGGIQYLEWQDNPFAL